MKTIPLFCFIVISSLGLRAQGKLIAKATGYYKAPHWQNAQTIKAAASDKGAAYDGLYDIATYKDFQFLNTNHLLTFPGVYIFNKNLQPVKAIDGGDCGWKAMQFISTLSDTSNVAIDTNIKFTVEELLGHAGFIAGDSTIISTGGFDYLYIYSWVTYLPKFTQSQFEFSKKIKANKNARIKVISLNEDYTAEWNKQPDEFLGKKVKDIDVKE